VQTRVAAILSSSGFIDSTLDDGEGPLGIVLEATPFYAEQGGQVADTGDLTGASCSFSVQDTKVGLPCWASKGN
jgi:alanyl-tRNA synthetase